jgi:hypothetical protein
MAPTHEPKRTPLDDIRDLAEDLLREANLASLGMQYALRNNKGRVKEVPVGTPEHLNGVTRYLRALADKADLVLER